MAICDMGTLSACQCATSLFISALSTYILRMQISGSEGNPAFTQANNFSHSLFQLFLFVTKQLWHLVKMHCVWFLWSDAHGSLSPKNGIWHRMAQLTRLQCMPLAMVFFLSLKTSQSSGMEKLDWVRRKLIKWFWAWLLNTPTIFVPHQKIYIP